MKSSIAATLFTVAGWLGFAAGAEASLVKVDVYGTVNFNAINAPPLKLVGVGQTAHTSFLVDTQVFVNSIPGDVRAYAIVAGSYTLSFSGGTSVGLGAGPAYFGVREGDPGVDGFFVSSSTTNLGGVALTQSPYKEDFHATYTNNTLDSLDILDAVGTYNFTGLTVFGYNLWAGGPDNVLLDVDFTHMTIAEVPAPATIVAFVPALIGLRRRRR